MSTDLVGIVGGGAARVKTAVRVRASESGHSTFSVLTKRTLVNTYCDGVIDFSNGSVFKLSAIHPQEIGPAVAPLMIQGEQIVACFKAVRDFVVFTNKRLIAVNVQGMTGKKRDFTSLPYSKVQAFSVETAGTFDLDAELDLWFSGLGKVRLEFKGNADIRQLGQMIATYVL